MIITFYKFPRGASPLRCLRDSRQPATCSAASPAGDRSAQGRRHRLERGAPREESRGRPARRGQSPLRLPSVAGPAAHRAGASRRGVSHAQPLVAPPAQPSVASQTPAKPRTWNRETACTGLAAFGAGCGSLGRVLGVPRARFCDPLVDPVPLVHLSCSSVTQSASPERSQSTRVAPRWRYPTRRRLKHLEVVRISTINEPHRHGGIPPNGVALSAQRFDFLSHADELAAGEAIDEIVDRIEDWVEEGLAIHEDTAEISAGGHANQKRDQQGQRCYSQPCGVIGVRWNSSMRLHQQAPDSAVVHLRNLEIPLTPHEAFSALRHVA